MTFVVLGRSDYQSDDQWFAPPAYSVAGATILSGTTSTPLNLVALGTWRVVAVEVNMTAGAGYLRVDSTTTFDGFPNHPGITRTATVASLSGRNVIRFPTDGNVLTVAFTALGGDVTADLSVWVEQTDGVGAYDLGTWPRKAFDNTAATFGVTVTSAPFLHAGPAYIQVIAFGGTAWTFAIRSVPQANTLDAFLFQVSNGGAQGNRPNVGLVLPAIPCVATFKNEDGAGTQNVWCSVSPDLTVGR